MLTTLILMLDFQAINHMVHNGSVEKSLVFKTVLGTLKLSLPSLFHEILASIFFIG